MVGAVTALRLTLAGLLGLALAHAGLTAALNVGAQDASEWMERP